jgi:hypothetical protein
MGVIVEDEEKPKKEEQEHMVWETGALPVQYSARFHQWGRITRARWTIPEMRCKA